MINSTTDLVQKFNHWKDTLEHVRNVQNNILKTCELFINGDRDMLAFWGTLCQIFNYNFGWVTLVEDMLERALVHDDSKFGYDEWLDFAEANYGGKLKQLEYGSPEYKQQLKTILGPALKHHYEVNDHHPEFWNDGLLSMPLPAVIEMLCDWEAASRRHNTGDVYKSVIINADRFGYGDDVKDAFKEFYDILLK